MRFLSSNCIKMQFRPELCTGPADEAYSAPSGSLTVWWKALETWSQTTLENSGYEPELIREVHKHELSHLNHSKRMQWRKHYSFAVEPVTWTTIWRSFRGFRTIPFWSSFIPGPIHQCRPCDTATRARQSGDHHYTMPATTWTCVLAVRMSRSWWLIIGRGKSRPALCCPPSSVVSRSSRELMRSATRGTAAAQPSAEFV